MEYPLSLTFKILALAPQLAVTDANDRLVFYVKQKAFKLREQVTVFADREQTRSVATIQADRVLDISAKYHFEDAQGGRFGAVRRAGVRSLWKAHYDVMRGDDVVFTIREDNALIKFLDGILYEIPLLGLVSGYVLHPSYTVARPDGTPMLHVKKKAAMWEGRFEIEALSELPPEEEALTTLAILMMVLLERSRG